MPEHRLARTRAAYVKAYCVLRSPECRDLVVEHRGDRAADVIYALGQKWARLPFEQVSSMPVFVQVLSEAL